MKYIVNQIADLQASGQNETLLTVLINTITRHGSAADAQQLLPLFLQTKDARLLLPIQAHGNMQMADEIFAHAIQDGALKEDFPHETLIALGYLQHAPTERVLIEYYKNLFENKGDWDQHVAVCLALLNFPCRGYEAIIKQQIEKCLQDWLFPEMIPALAVKTGDNTLAEKLYHHGSTKASSDASAGLILGIALFGCEKRELFKNIILNPDWEAASTGTGNIRYTMMGMSFLNITFAELFADIKAIAPTEKERMHQHLFLLSDLLQRKNDQPPLYGVRAIPPHPEPAAQIYETLFAPPDGSSVFEVANQYIPDDWLKEELTEEWNRLEELYRQKMMHEIEMEFLKAKSNVF